MNYTVRHGRYSDRGHLEAIRQGLTEAWRSIATNLASPVDLLLLRSIGNRRNIQGVPVDHPNHCNVILHDKRHKVVPLGRSNNFVGIQGGAGG